MYREVNEMPKCASCGKLLNVDGIEASRLDRRVMFCSERCVEVFDTYKEPKYGSAALDGVPEFV
jgi:hypothetical protein